MFIVIHWKVADVYVHGFEVSKSSKQSKDSVKDNRRHLIEWLRATEIEC